METESKPNCLKRGSDKIVTVLETGFAKLGRLIGNNPVKSLIICTVLAGACGVGMLKFTQTTDNQTIWVPANSDVINHKNWVEDNFPPSTRFVNMIFEADNILSSKGLKAMYDIYNRSMHLEFDGGKNITSVCQKIIGQCFVTSILELWKYNGTKISSLSKADILLQINSVTISPTFLAKFDINAQIGGKDLINGQIETARAASMTWILLGDNKEESEAMEQVLISLGQGGHQDVTIYVYATRSFGDEGGSAIVSDVSFLSAGYFLVIFYLTIVLGRFNCIEQRAWLAFCGLCVIGLSILCSFGLSSAAGYEYGPLHSVLPFLLLGIGVDDVFVVVGALGSLSPQERTLPLVDRMSLTLRHAGVSITVTSLTDVVAFGIGATTTLPALKSFCIYATIGIMAVYILSATFFVAGLTLDIKRAESNRNACCCCKHSDGYKTNECSKKELLPWFIGKIYAQFLLKIPVKIVVVIFTLGLLGVNIWGTINLKQEFDSRWFLPTDSYASKYFEVNDVYFPNDGQSAAVYCGNIDYFNSRAKFDHLVTNLSSSQYINNGTVDSWYQWYATQLNIETDPAIKAQLDGNNHPSNKSAFISILSSYVKGRNGGQRYQRNLVFSDNNTDIGASYITFRYTKFENSAQQIEAMDGIQNMVKDFIPECFTYGRGYLQWYTNKVIQRELYRNLGLAAGCVFVVTFILIANLWTSLMVFTCVIGTLVDVAGCMHFWGLTIDTVTGIILILAIGLAVDYSAHIGHCFMTIRGSKNDRVKFTLVEIGSPVFSGGFSTFLAFILLAMSNSYVFTTFFKVFLLVVIFGLFHGLVYLPTLLSWIGPQPYLSAIREPDSERHYTENSNQNSQEGTDNMAMEKEYPDTRFPRQLVVQEKLSKENLGHGHPYIPPPDYTPPPPRSNRMDHRNEIRSSKKQNGITTESVNTPYTNTYDTKGTSNGMPRIDT